MIVALLLPLFLITVLTPLELLPFLGFTRAQPLLIIVYILHAEVLPRHEVEVGEELEQKASDAITPADEARPAPVADRLVHWLTDKSNFYEYYKY